MKEASRKSVVGDEFVGVYTYDLLIVMELHFYLEAHGSELFDPACDFRGWYLTCDRVELLELDCPPFVKDFLECDFYHVVVSGQGEVHDGFQEN